MRRADNENVMPEPILVSIAAALAAKSATSLYEVATLATHLAAEKEDPAFSAELRNTWQQINVGEGGVVNRVTGNVSGKVLQTRDIEGGVSF